MYKIQSQAFEDVSLSDTIDHTSRRLINTPTVSLGCGIGAEIFWNLLLNRVYIEYLVPDTVIYILRMVLT